MKSIFTSIIILASLLISCENSSSNSKSEESEKNTQLEKQSFKKDKKLLNRKAFEENLEAFNSCKINKTGNGKCKKYLAKAVCEYYDINDLKEGNDYIAYDEIPKRLKELESWENIGAFNEKNVLSALDCLNNSEKPVLIYNTGDSYVHVVALKPDGKLFKSGKWGNISVPSCVSYFTKRNDSFTEKGINYAFKSANDLTIWTKK
ncbi:MAG: hypothetical protein CMD18_01310 [Flavobacteriales bacterium]|nr:hypothetical protein [Flavobacteriales bacterium]